MRIKTFLSVLYTWVCLIITNSARIFCDHWRNSRKPLFYFATRFFAFFEWLNHPTDSFPIEPTYVRQKFF